MALVSLLLAYFDKIVHTPPSTISLVTHAGAIASVDQNKKLFCNFWEVMVGAVCKISAF